MSNIKADLFVKTNATSTLTIATGVITITEGFHIVAAETGTTDNLDTININFGFTPTVTYLTLIADTGDTITLTHGVGNISFADGANHDITATTPLTLVRSSASATWYALKAVAASGDIPWAAPGAIGSATPNTGAFETLSTTGNLTIGDGTGTITTVINGLVNTSRSLLYQTGGGTRWSFATGGGAESGGNVSSNFAIVPYDDSGTILGTATRTIVERATGNWHLGSNALPAAKLQVSQGNSAGAIPPLYLQQSDVDQDMIELSCTIGVGNAIEAVGVKTLTTTHFVKVTITGVGDRYIPVGTIA